MRTMVSAASLVLLLAGAQALAQPVPQPFPKRPAPQDEAPATLPADTPAAMQTPPGAPPGDVDLGVPLYPNAQFIASYDAGRGQRYYLFGVATPYADIVAYYRNVLRSRGDVMYDQPPIHIFETGRYREDTMAFPPSVTVKDYTWGGMQGYLVPLPGGQSQRYPTIIQIVPVRAGDAR